MIQLPTRCRAARRGPNSARKANAAFLAIGITLCGKFDTTNCDRLCRQRKIRAGLLYAVLRLSGNPFVQCLKHGLAQIVRRRFDRF
jgi:hypothetical protein